jgi:predicted AAA+ superfamily ATPase
MLSDQIEQLDELISAEGDGTASSSEDFITQGMQDLITEGIARLAGASTQAIFHLKQAWAAARRICWSAFGLLAGTPDLRSQVLRRRCRTPAPSRARHRRLQRPQQPRPLLLGRDRQATRQGRAVPEFWTGGPKAPDEKDWLKLFEGDEPVLILLDEMPPYFHYLDTQKVGNGTVADIATRAFANLLTAAGKKKNVCVVVSDLAAAYDTGGKLINRALKMHAQNSAARSAPSRRWIWPPTRSTTSCASGFSRRCPTSRDRRHRRRLRRKLEEAAKSRPPTAAPKPSPTRSRTYPFHPRLKNVVALFKENEQFKQTRGLIELVSRLLKSVWDRNATMSS